MIYTELTKKAMLIACNAHHGQHDKSGFPYIFHPYHLAEQMNDEISVCVALLHDVVEDTDITIHELENKFPPEITEAVKLLTYNGKEDYFDYIRRLKTNPYAKLVKIADLTHNLDQSRLLNTDDIPEYKRAYWKEKYTHAYEILTENKL
ncbi:MAG: HD domain-containing protein [Ruminococcus sp.]|nr:HD domain-containing protein [Ruminococcus sp.]MDE6784513.1 HD domain-containing protein [Ruminococcus sp.]